MRWCAALLLAVAFLNGPISPTRAQVVGGALAAGQAKICCTPHDSDCTQPNYTRSRIALIVGVDKYGGKDASGDVLRDLVNAGKDARAIAETLAPSYEVRCLIDLKKEAFFEELAQLRKHLLTVRESQDLSGNSVIVHFSGHGFKIDNTDSIVLSGSYSSKQQAIDEGAIPVVEVSRKLGGLELFDILLVFDACRNRAETDLVKPDWAKGFMEPLEQSSQAIAYATSGGSFAHDSSARIGAEKNGAYVFSLVKYFRFLGLELADVFLLAHGDPSLALIQQLPRLSQQRDFAPIPWFANVSDCDAAEAQVVKWAQHCRRTGGHGCKKSLCDAVRKLDAVSSAVGPSVCSRDRLTGFFNEVASCPSPAVAERLGVTRIAGGGERVYCGVP
jgi:hypothetical protein